MRLYILITIVFFEIFISKASFAQKIEGNSTWEGKLGRIPIILRLATDSISFNQIAVYDSPSQGAFNLKVSTLKITDDSLSAYSQALRGGFSGKFDNNKKVIIGKWKQGVQDVPMTFIKVNNKAPLKRPQMPTAPYPYEVEEVIYYNEAKTIAYGATLTIPRSENLVPVVILISGSGQEDRDETIFGHKPFLILADHLSRHGIAVLRVDDRGIGNSTGDVRNATSVDFANDVIQSVNFIKSQQKIDHNRIGLIGHSEGALIASLASIQSKDVRFIVSLAGVGVKGSELLKMQTQTAYKQMGFNSDELKRLTSLVDLMSRLVIEYVDDAKLRTDFRKQFVDWRSKQPSEFLVKAKLKGPGSDQIINQMANNYFSPWTRYILKYDPSKIISKLKIPVLALNGGKDVQVDAIKNLAGFETYLTLAGNKNFKTVLLPNLNHLFQTANTGEIQEYSTIQETFNVEALNIITSWIQAQVNP